MGMEAILNLQLPTPNFQTGPRTLGLEVGSWVLDVLDPYCCMKVVSASTVTVFWPMTLSPTMTFTR